MKCTPLLILLIFASCRKGIEGEAICRNEPLPFQPKRVVLGMGREAIVAQIGKPIDRLVSPFGRETWIYPHVRVQTTYSNSGPAGWYLIGSEAPINLVLQLDQEGRLTGLSAQPDDPDTFQIRNPMVFKE